MVVLTLFLLPILTINTIAYAETTSYKQQILPIDCVYEVIDVGTQKLRYLTPETCPVDPGPPVITEPSGESPDTTAGSNWVYIAPIQIAPPEQNAPDNLKEEVKGSTEQIRDIVYKNKDSMLIVALIALLWAATIIVLKRRNILH
jgi:hypothetical protein